MTSTLQPDKFLASAHRLATPVKRGRPLQADLRRAVSAAYYAMFHTLAGECANSFVGKINKNKIGNAWSQVYRALDHRRVREACQSQNSRTKATYRRFPPSIQAFGDLFVVMQARRHEADYDPLAANFLASGTMNDINLVEQAIQDFLGATAEDRRAFCVFVMFDLRK